MAPYAAPGLRAQTGRAPIRQRAAATGADRRPLEKRHRRWGFSSRGSAGASGAPGDSSGGGNTDAPPPPFSSSSSSSSSSSTPASGEPQAPAVLQAAAVPRGAAAAWRPAPGSRGLLSNQNLALGGSVAAVLLLTVFRKEIAPLLRWGVMQTSSLADKSALADALGNVNVESVATLIAVALTLWWTFAERAKLDAIEASISAREAAMEARVEALEAQMAEREAVLAARVEALECQLAAREAAQEVARSGVSR